MKLNIKKFVGGYNENKSKKIKIYKGGDEFIKLVGGDTVFNIRDIFLVKKIYGCQINDI